MDTSTKTIRICLGSSCYTRGNAENLNLIKDFVESNAMVYHLDFRGQLCSEKCNRGPIIAINQKVFEEVTPLGLMKILSDNLLEEKP